MRIARWLTLISLFAAALAASGYFAANWWSSQGAYVRETGFEGIVMNSGRFRNAVHADGWALAPGQLNTLEADLVLFVAATSNRFDVIKSDLPRYYRQYYTWQDWRGRHITTEFYHPALITRYEWLHRTPVASGSSGKFWRVEYQVGTRAFTNLFIDGDTP